MNRTASFRSLDDWLPWLESLSPREIVLGLERVDEVLARLGLGRPELVINVAGTNGKGSSVAMLEAILRADGLSTACYTSPHISRYNERMRIEGRAADDHAVVSALETVEQARGDVPLTFFEFGTLAALVAFDAANVDAWLLEIGMGGRLDAVNAVEPDACLITNVSMDHCAWLGDDVESIAREKAGVMRPGKPAIFSAASVPAAVFTTAVNVGADLRVAARDFGIERESDGWAWRGKDACRSGLVLPSVAGDNQLDNAAGVLALLEALDGDRLPAVSVLNEALSSIELRGRYQRVGSCWVLDVAHNPAAGAALAETLARDKADAARVHAVVGMLGDKDVSGFVAPLNAVVDTWIATPVEGARGGPADGTARDIANTTGQPCLVATDLGSAMSEAENRVVGDDLVVVCGSFFVVGPALDWLGNN
jgi:dihydrofolate synthase/folylpolyglutamate synthase